MRRVGTLGTFALVTAVGAGWCADVVRAGPTDEPAPVIEPAPELVGANARGAAEVDRAQKLARKKRVAEAVAILEQVAATLPSAQHDCNLALAYLRAGALTQAQLRWDLARLRGTAPPSWCTGTLAADLAAALRDQGYVPLALSVTPAAAVVEVAGLRLRKLDLVWLAPGTYAITARADGLVDGTTHVAVAAPSARAAIALAPPAVVVAPPDRGADEPADPTDPKGTDLEDPKGTGADPAGGPADPTGGEPRPIALPVVPRPAPVRWPAYLGAGLGGAALVGGVVMHARASSSRDRANGLAADSDDFAQARDDFGRERALAIGGYAVAAAGLGFATWWWLGHRDDGDAARAPAVGLTVGGGGTVVTVGWPWSTP